MYVTVTRTNVSPLAIQSLLGEERMLQSANEKVNITFGVYQGEFAMYFRGVIAIALMSVFMGILF